MLTAHKNKNAKKETFLGFKLSDVAFIMLIMLKCQRLMEFNIYRHDKFYVQLS